ncbi:phage head-tail connector protein [Fulvimarina sp. 2208YS6-2-32]|uniref:Phage head-tail connector protein n=1 Tax=Fulvimarina uroteuthidis TaxID=3098149 RepID=A0ABU5I147_9HYPH|nr:phage head-tail connector protein [Fulvimarina sp. 2208YS6-2-32]MDY8109110.1 phage head-tail connector protein [Fulvimarina sp. 2208YS6-2-32]
MVTIDLGRAVSPVGLAEAKAWARIERGDEDDTLALLLSAASEAAEAELGLALSRRKFRIVADRSPPDGVLSLKLTPLVSVDAVLAYARDGTEIAFDPALEAAILDDGSGVRLSGAVRAAGVNGIDVTVTAGLAAEAIPAEVKHAILVAAATWFEARIAAGDAVTGILPSPARRLLRARRRMRL